MITHAEGLGAPENSMRRLIQIRLLIIATSRYKLMEATATADANIPG